MPVVLRSLRVLPTIAGILQLKPILLVKAWHSIVDFIYVLIEGNVQLIIVLRPEGQYIYAELFIAVK